MKKPLSTESFRLSDWSLADLARRGGKTEEADSASESRKPSGSCWGARAPAQLFTVSFAEGFLRLGVAPVNNCGSPIFALACFERAMVKRTFLILGLVATLCVVGAVGWFFFGDTIQEHLRRRPFDGAAWKGEQTLTNAVRIRMVDDLLRRHSFRGMTREQLTAIVGEPDKTEYFKDWDLV